MTLLTVLDRGPCLLSDAFPTEQFGLKLFTCDAQAFAESAKIHEIEKPPVQNMIFLLF